MSGEKNDSTEAVSTKTRETKDARSPYKEEPIAQAVYIQYMENKAFALAQRHLASKGVLSPPLYDPQGRLVLDIVLTDKDISALAEEIQTATGNDCAPTREGLEKALGIKVTDVTVVSLDINGNKALKDSFHSKLRDVLWNVPDNHEDPQVILDAFANTPKGSIIPLQQEFHFHLALAARVYQDMISQKAGIDPPIPYAKFQVAHSEAMIEVNQLVLEAYAKALTKAYKNKKIDIAVLNEHLDASRAEIESKAQEILLRKIKNIDSVNARINTLQLTDKDFKNAKHTAESTSATANDIIHLDHEQGIAEWIKGSENTAHNRVQGDKFAHRQIITHVLNADGTVTENTNQRIQIRTPSPVIKRIGDYEHETNDSVFIHDAKTKIAAIPKEYNLANRLETDGKIPKAFIYNSYTAINDAAGDIKGNLQTESARHILKGVHLHNKEQGDEGVFCFVQNISVNGRGSDLSYDSVLMGDSELLNETTLMAEMAMLHTIYDVLPEAGQQIIRAIFNEYKSFLRTAKEGDYFINSSEGVIVKGVIKGLKENLNAQLSAPSPDDTDVVYNAKLALARLMANNIHMDNDYAQLVQALSVFVEKASIGGCKSGNERAQGINGRVAVLDSVANESANDKSSVNRISKLLSEIAHGNTIDVKSKAEKLRDAIDIQYNNAGLQAGNTMISNSDQGAPAKLESTSGVLKSIKGMFLSNFGESKLLTNLQQSCAGALQAHKGLVEGMQKAWGKIVEPVIKVAKDAVADFNIKYADLNKSDAGPSRRHGLVISGPDLVQLKKDLQDLTKTDANEQTSEQTDEKNKKTDNGGYMPG